MNILIVSVRGPTNSARRGGAQDYIENVARPWLDEGHAVQILCGQELVGGAMLPADEVVRGIRVSRVGGPGNRVLPLVTATRRQAGSADLIVENIMGFPLLLPLFLYANVPIVAIKHHFEGAAFIKSHGLLRGGWGLFLERVIQPLAYRRVQLVAVSEKTRQQFLSIWPRPMQPVAVVPPGLKKVAPEVVAKRNEWPTVFYVGALDVRRKRVDQLISAFKKVRATVPAAQLVIAGDGPDRERLERMALGAPIEFAGFIDEERKAVLMQQAWIFASPSMTEGFGITWVEANAHGLPVVGYDLSLDTVNQSCARMVPVGDVEQLAGQIAELLTNHDLREQLARGGLENAARFSWQRSSARLLEVLRGAIARRGPGRPA